MQNRLKAHVLGETKTNTITVFSHQHPILLSLITSAFLHTNSTRDRACKPTRKDDGIKGLIRRRGTAPAPGQLVQLGLERKDVSLKLVIHLPEPLHLPKTSVLEYHMEGEQGPSLYLCREDVAFDLVGVVQHILGTLDTALGLDKTTLGILQLPDDMVGQAIRLDEFSRQHFI